MLSTPLVDNPPVVFFDKRGDLSTWALSCFLDRDLPLFSSFFNETRSLAYYLHTFPPPEVEVPCL